MKSISLSSALIATSALFSVFIACHCKPLKLAENKLEVPEETLQYLKRFGYLREEKSKSASLLNENVLTNAIKKLQRFGGLPESGILCNETIKLMKSPRCGVKDIEGSPRKKRFTIIGNPWRKKVITFYVESYVPALGRDFVAKNIQNALNIWGKHADIKFKEVFQQNADIIVSFARGYHGDMDPFDGPGRTLAHAYAPSGNELEIEGDIHFDADEQWSANPQLDGGVNFFEIALHELGHSLGLGHSEVPSAIMYAYYRGIKNELDHDDVAALNRLYGTKKGSSSPPVNKPPAQLPPAPQIPVYHPQQPQYPVYYNPYQPVWFLG